MVGTLPQPVSIGIARKGNFHECLHDTGYRSIGIGTWYNLNLFMSRISAKSNIRKYLYGRYEFIYTLVIT